MDPNQNKLSPRIQALIAIILLAMFAGVLFLPAFVKDFEADADVKQTLFALVTAVVFFFIGKSTGSTEREAQLTQAAIAPAPQPIVVPPIITPEPLPPPPPSFPLTAGVTTFQPETPAVPTPPVTPVPPVKATRA